jgi:signal peptidase I
MKRRNPIWASILSLVVPGLGQVYNGQVLKGVVFYVGSALLLFVLGWSGLLFGLWGIGASVFASIILWVAIIVEAALTARRLGTIALRRYNRWYVYVLLIICAGLLGVALKPLSGVRTYKMPASSMEPTVKRGDNFIVQMRYYYLSEPKRSDIVIFPIPRNPSKDLVKRIVALGGQKLEIRDKKVFIDDQEMSEPWAVHRSPETTPAAQSPRDNLGPIIVPKGHVFGMGDNRDFSLDSRFFGPIDVREIKGRALSIYWADDISRIGTSLQ